MTEINSKNEQLKTTEFKFNKLTSLCDSVNDWSTSQHQQYQHCFGEFSTWDTKENRPHLKTNFEEKYSTKLGLQRELASWYNTKHTGPRWVTATLESIPSHLPLPVQIYISTENLWMNMRQIQSSNLKKNSTPSWLSETQKLGFQIYSCTSLLISTITMINWWSINIKNDKSS